MDGVDGVSDLPLARIHRRPPDSIPVRSQYSVAETDWFYRARLAMERDKIRPGCSSRAIHCRARTGNGEAAAVGNDGPVRQGGPMAAVVSSDPVGGSVIKSLVLLLSGSPLEPLDTFNCFRARIADHPAPQRRISASLPSCLFHQSGTKSVPASESFRHPFC